MREKIKNIYAEKYRKNAVELNDDAILKSMGQTFQTGFLLEGGKDEVDGKTKEYIIVKMYLKDK
jgi:hypothetical protein